MSTIPTSPYTFEEVQDITNSILKLTSYRPKIGIVCGTGLGNLANDVEDKFTIPYQNIPKFPQSTVKGHEGNLIFGKLSGHSVVLMQGRFHPYEGYSTHQCTLPIRVLKLIGIEILFLTNAAGGLEPTCKIGDIYYLKDHINMPGMGSDNPLCGPNDERFGPRFLSLSDAYDSQLISLAHEAVKQLSPDDKIKEGIYFMQMGPTFETAAECRLAKILGANLLGMSTTHEVIVARHMSIRCFAMSLVTNKAIVDYNTDDHPNHEAILDVGRGRAKFMTSIVKTMLSLMPINN